MNFFSNIFRAVSNSYPALKLRDLLDLRPSPFHPCMSESVSDLFLWRVDDVWETYFDLFHIAGVINPNFNDQYDVLIYIYDRNGALINTEIFSIQFGEVQLLKLKDFLCGHIGYGTFAIFHMVDNDCLLDGLSCISERGYTSFRRSDDRSLLRSYAHGNLPVIGMNQHTRQVRVLGLRSVSRKFFYKPQVTFHDCSKFEICVVNPVSQAIFFLLELLDVHGKPIEVIENSLLEKGSFCFSSGDSHKSVHSINITSQVRILRPLIFKYYQSHFDVFHA